MPEIRRTPGARAGDLLGRRRMIVRGLGLFTVASVAGSGRRHVRRLTVLAGRVLRQRADRRRADPRRRAATASYSSPPSTAVPAS
jgi:hypothetical protein